MSSFLDNYEDVNARIKRFRSEFPTGRLEVFIEDIDLKIGYVLFKALAYRNYEDEKPSAIDYAFEMRGDQKIGGRWFIETGSTSAIGRVIGLLSPSDTRPTKQDMESVERFSASSAAVEQNDLWATTTTTMTTKEIVDEVGMPTVASVLDDLSAKIGVEVLGESPLCKHGHRILREGTAKTGKPYRGYACPERTKASQCEMLWFKQLPDRTWVIQ
jgi:hypothetical protein